MAHGSFHDLRPDAFQYAWDNSVAPALELESGEAVLLHVRDASDEQINEGSGVEDVGKLDFSHVNPVSGPVFVKGAQPGDTLQVELLEFHPHGWGWTAIIPGFGLLADEFPEPWLRISHVDAEQGLVRFSERVTLPYRPFPGTLGDTHAAQGDGEVCGTAIETAMEAVVRLTVRKDIRVDAPQYDVPAGLVAAHEQSSYHVCTGVGPDLLECARDSVRATVTWLGDRHGLDRQEAYALASVACDLRIHEVVDAPNWVVGCFVPESIFAQGG